MYTANYYFVRATVAVDSSHMTASSSTSCSRFSPTSRFVNGHVSTMWFMVCRWPQSQEGDWARPWMCKLAHHWQWFNITDAVNTLCSTQLQRHHKQLIASLMLNPLWLCFTVRTSKHCHRGLYIYNNNHHHFTAIIQPAPPVKNWGMPNS